MTGMKDGAATSPFDDDEDEQEDDREAESAEQQPSPQSRSTDARRESRTAETSAGSQTELPWIYRRENSRDGREITKQLHLQRQTAQRESEMKTSLERRLDQTVYLADLREAALLVAMDHEDELVDQLREWGYESI